MARTVTKMNEDQHVCSRSVRHHDKIESRSCQQVGQNIPSDHPDNLSAILSVIDSMPDNMLCDLHDGLPQERDDL
ncbi:hypothetical protein NS228_07475 [Methylobacterium indicum]|uniref:Uncharacterized protein n=1 Tax=Methylobacterium indicum TaxID=1775910 RepID=A0A0J6RDT4_9HYPH|nr:hypothetical protein [Methylobacterium indicum]KMO21080.1 hypothetical protein QR79_17300 [Methylobacterium indicum]KMO24347.1 hypothetical protein QR78_01085 [Methylobacterium indicum]KTS32541.1 hypothetical protein NS229_12530 [Methylobacterium indicum]KTS41182.1 hypothetical protein NS228_07475 [Methylobacterium indicum]KTS50601.1 hypothetical protein NS230_15720 [Methylobacterium indicum]